MTTFSLCKTFSFQSVWQLSFSVCLTTFSFQPVRSYFQFSVCVTFSLCKNIQFSICDNYVWQFSVFNVWQLSVFSLRDNFQFSVYVTKLSVYSLRDNFQISVCVTELSVFSLCDQLHFSVCAKLSVSVFTFSLCEIGRVLLLTSVWWSLYDEVCVTSFSEFLFVTNFSFSVCLCVE